LACIAGVYHAGEEELEPYIGVADTCMQLVTAMVDDLAAYFGEGSAKGFDLLIHGGVSRMPEYRIFSRSAIFAEQESDDLENKVDLAIRLETAVEGEVR
jgi:hypothetical protein